MFSQFHTLRYDSACACSHADRWVDYLSEKSIEGCSSCGSSSNILEKSLVLKNNPPPPPELALELTYLYFLKILLSLIYLKNTSKFSQIFSLFKSLNQFIKVQSIVLLCFGLFIFKEQSNNDKEYVPERG